MARAMPRVLLAEDEALVAMETEFLLEQCGCAVLGPAATVSGTLSILQSERPDGAVLDINLGDAPIWPVLRLLYEREVPFILVTGYSVEKVPSVAHGSTILSKPASLQSLGQALSNVGVIPDWRGHGPA